MLVPKIQLMKKLLNFFRQTRRPVLRVVVLSSILAFIGIFAKFSYIIVLKDAGRYAIAELFNYRYLSQFLWTLGNEIFAVSVGAILLIGSRFMESTTPIKKVFRRLSFLIIAVGFYFMGWVFFDPFYSGPTEIGMAILFSIASTSILIPFVMYLNKEIHNIRELKASFIDFLVSLKPNYKKMTKHALRPNLFNEARDEALDEIRKDSDEFQKKLYEKAEELID